MQFQRSDIKVHWRRAWVPVVAAGTGMLWAISALAHLGPIPPSLKNTPVPPVPGLLDGPDPIVVNRDAAIVLGKALFWDTNVGSDGMACASCHFHAGADARVKNQLAPAGKNADSTDRSFSSSKIGDLHGPNYALRRGNFPFHQTVDPVDGDSAVIYTTDDVISSSGTFGGSFRGVAWYDDTQDDCSRAVDPVFHVGAIGTRRVEPRNSPTVINAVFNFRNLWDGEANNIFNGSSPWGDRDPNAGVWVKTGNNVVKQRLRLQNSSLASQAVSPPLSDIEMSCSGRVFADLGRKLMWRQPLETQKVHWTDSVLGARANSAPGNLQTGLNTYYYTLVKEAFASKYWSATQRGPFGSPPKTGKKTPLAYSQYEANFSMFFGLSIQMYLSTLVSDDSPFDRSARDANGVPVDLPQSAIDGFQNFRTGHCNLCHLGPVFTSAAIVTNADLVASNPQAFGTETFSISTTRNVVTRMSVNKGSSLIDTGFAGTGVTAEGTDAGLGGRDPFGNPLSFADQYLQLIAGNPSAVKDPYVTDIRPCDFDLPLAKNDTAAHAVIFTQVEGVIPQSQETSGCFHPEGAFLPTPVAAATELGSPTNKKMLSATNGSFKIPSLRNVELTGPYMHNGGMSTLEQVLEFYTRGGNFSTSAKNFGFVFPQPLMQFVPQARADIVSFLKSLTDERVRYERAPFDHPEIRIPHGHAGDHTAAAGGNPLGASLAADEFLTIEAVGAGGRSTPLPSYYDSLAP